MARSDPVLEIPSEHFEQREFVKHFRKKYNDIRIFAIPNGGKRGKAEAMRLKLEGVDPGVPDLFVPEWMLFIEMKRVKKGYLSKEQKEYKAYLEDCSYTVLVCKGCDDAIKKVEGFLSDKNS